MSTGNIENNNNNSSTPPSSLPKAWKDCKEVYLPPEQLAAALQDIGSQKSTTRKGKVTTKHVFPNITKIVRKLYQNILQKYSPKGMDSNPTRGMDPLLLQILQRRKHFDLSDVDPWFHQFGNDGKVFLITNNKMTCGIDIAIESFQDYVETTLKMKTSQRTPNDGLRLALIMLDEQFRGPVSVIMSKKKSRAMSDQSLDPNLAFFEKLLDDVWYNSAYLVEIPSDERICHPDISDKDWASWHPNDPGILEHKRSAEWLMATWETYIRPRYKKALDNWNKETGGGDGSPGSFINYCAVGDRWLLPIYLRDLECNLLLASGTAGRMPSELVVEAGFEPGGGDNQQEGLLSELSTPSSSVGGTSSSSMKFLAEKVIDAKNRATDAKIKQTEQLKQMNDNLQFMLRKQSEEQHQNVGEARTSEDQVLGKITELSNTLTNQPLLNSFSSLSREVFVERVVAKRRRLIDRLRSGAGDESSDDEQDK